MDSPTETNITGSILKKVRQIEIRTNRLVDEALSGHYHSIFKGRGINFDEVREYVPGDDVRTIDWNVTAREGKPFIKKFTEERELTILLIIDISASGLFGSALQTKREIAAEIGSVLAFSAIRNQDRVGLLLFTDEVELYIPPKKGRSHVLRVIREILFYKPLRTGTDIPKALDFANRVIPKKAINFLISDYCLNEPFAESLAILKKKLQVTNKRNDLIAVCIKDPREFELIDAGLMLLEDLESEKQLEIDTRNPSIRKAYSDYTQSLHDELKQVIQASGVDLLDLWTHKPYIGELLRFFQLRERRR